MNGAHPPWCDPTRCEAGLHRAHSSMPAAVNHERGSTAVVRTRLWRRDDGSFPFNVTLPITWLELVTGDSATGARQRVDLTLGQAAQLCDQLADAISAAGGNG